MDAAESIRAVSYIFGGLVHPMAACWPAVARATASSMATCWTWLVTMFLVGWLMPVVFFGGFYPFVHVLMMYAK